MSIYLDQTEADRWRSLRKAEPGATMHWAMQCRADARASSPGLMDAVATVDWWHLVVEYLAEAAMAYRLKPGARLGQWIGAVVDDVVQRDEDDWVGPWFRRRNHEPPQGYLETAHVCVALAAALDLAGDALSDVQRERTLQTLRQRGIPLCTRWLDGNEYHNQRCILGAGLAAAAVATDEREGLARAVGEFELCADMFQPDGSYGETNQYASYAAWGMMVMHESLVRHDPSLVERLSPAPYARCVNWWASNLMYVKPLTGWGAAPRPRMVNFGDAGAIAAPDGDVLLHIAARCKDTMPEQAALARWLFDRTHRHTFDTGPFDRASFGFVTRPGFLAPPLWTAAAEVEPKSPAALNLDVLQAFTNGDVIARDAWQGRTVLAVRGGGEPFHVQFHNHADLNSFILAHQQERLLVDPGHSCYRGAPIHHDRATAYHNTCTFSRGDRADAPRLAHQRRGRSRELHDASAPGPPLARGGRRLLAERQGEVTVIGSECADVYDEPVTRFARFWIVAGPHVVFVVDHIVATEPIRTHWHWVLNNRDHGLRLKVVMPDRLVARRGDAGMKLFHVSDNLDANSGRMHHAYVHDAYHPRPAQLGEGRPDSGIVVNFIQREATTHTLTTHAIALDTYGQAAGWHMSSENDAVALESPEADSRWTVQPSPTQLIVREQESGQVYTVSERGDDAWTLTRE